MNSIFVCANQGIADRGRDATPRRPDGAARCPCRARRVHFVVVFAAGLLLPLLLLAGCANPIGARKASTRRVFEQTSENAIRTHTYSDQSRLVLYRFDLSARFKQSPAEALQALHAKACADDRRDLLYALAELSYYHAEDLQRSKLLKPWKPKPAEDYFLCSAIYAYLYLTSSGSEPPPGPFDPHFIFAVALYNRALARGLAPAGDTNGVVALAGGTRNLPPGPVTIGFDHKEFPFPMENYERFLSADEFLVQGLRVRNLQSGVGATLIGVGKTTNSVRLTPRVPATVLLRTAGNVKEWGTGGLSASLDLYAGYNSAQVDFGSQSAPLRTDTTAPLAHALNQNFVWKVGMQQFFSAKQEIKNDVYPTQPYQAGRIPVVFVHGTFSSPVWWAEMWNTLRADPVLRERCQFWYYIYNSGNSIAFSAATFRDSLTNIVHRFDPEGKDPALRQMVIIGHSQGGLLCKMAVTDPGDKLWQAITDKNLDDLKLTPEQKAKIERNVFFSSLPFVTRVVFIATPHRGSYMATSFVRKLAARFMSLPGDLINFRQSIAGVMEQLKLPPEMRAVPTSLDSMSPNNKVLLALAAVPPVPRVTAHTIAAIKGSDQPPAGGDGVVKYISAHVPYVESELVVRSSHSCQGKPVTIEEVRRILLEHLAEYK